MTNPFASRLSNPVRSLLVGLVLAAAPVAAAPAVAQFGGQAGFAEAFRPDFLARDMNLFVETLAIEEWQRPILETLLEDYQVSFNAGVDQVRQRMTEMKDAVAGASPDRVMAMIMGPIDQWTREKAELRDRFLEDVRSQLSPAQQENWPRFERALRREKYLDQGELSGESLNLLLVLRETELSPQVMSAIRPTVDEYELRLDEALQTRQSQITSVQEDVKSAMSANDFDAGLRAMSQIMAARVMVRQAQDAGIESIAASIGESGEEAAATEFRATALQRGYAKVYRDDPIIPLFARALEIEDLTADQRGALVVLQGSYVVEVDAVNLRYVDVLRTEEPREPQRRIEIMKARQRGETIGGNRESEAIAAIRTEREDLYQRTREAIFAILNPEQQAQLPGFGKVAGTEPRVGKPGTDGLRGASEVDPLSNSNGGRASQPVQKEADSDLQQKQMNQKRRGETGSAGGTRGAPVPSTTD
jgi:hypothetical protein